MEFTVEYIAELANRYEDGEHCLEIEYREPNGDRRRGELLTAGYSLSGKPILQIGSFTNWVEPLQVCAYRVVRI